jgi:hypothetical protein
VEFLPQKNKCTLLLYHENQELSETEEVKA